MEETEVRSDTTEVKGFLMRKINGKVKRTIRSGITLLTLAALLLCSVPAFAAGSILTEEEESWVGAHDVLRVGYMNNYLPFSASAETGEATGIVANVVPLMLQNAGLEDRIRAEYIAYDDNETMYAALRNGVIDTAFPTYGEPAYAGANGAEFTGGVIGITVDLAYKGDYSADVTRRIAVNKHNHLQDYYTKQYYPDAEIIYFDNIAGCLDAVADGSADSTLLNGFRTRALLSGVKYASVNASQVPGIIELCFAVERNNTQLLSILNKAIDNTEEAEVTAFTYGYVNAMNTYTLNDFIRDNLSLVVLVIFAFIAIVAALIATGIRSKTAEKELVQRIEFEKQTERAKSVISAMVEDFDYINSTNLKTGEITRYAATDKFYQVESKIDRNLTPRQRLEVLFKTIVHPAEWERFQRLTSEGTLKKELERNPIYKFECLTVSPEGKEEYYRFKFAYMPDEPNFRIMGLLNIDDNVRREMETAAIKTRLENKVIIDSLADAYRSLYLVELNTGRFRSLKGSSTLQKGYGRVNDDDAFSREITKWINTDVLPEDRAAALEACSLEYMRRQFKTIRTYSRTIRYKSNNYRYCEMRFTRTGDYEETSHCFLSFIDNHEYIMAQKTAQEQLATLAQQKAELESERLLKEKVSEQMNRVMELSDNLQTICEVETETGRYDIYSYNSDYAGSVLANMAKGEDFYADAHKDSETIVYPEDRELVLSTFGSKEYVKKVLKEKGSFTADYRMLMDGEPVWYRVKVVKKAGDEDRFLVGVFCVDERVRREENHRRQLEEALFKAEAANKAKSNFLFNMSHDIRTPMNAITGYTAIAKKHADSPEYITEYLNKIDVSSQQLLTLVNQVLEMSRIESGRITLEETPADVIEMTEEVRIITSADANAKGIQLTAHTGGILHRNVLIDVSRANQIITNILGNAVKYTFEGGSVDYYLEELPCQREGYGLYRITVRDTGIGMSEEFQKHIFEEFTRENTTTVSRIQGTGLGMSIVKRLVDLMDGTIEIKSKTGEGTTVTVTVPMKWDADAQNRQEEVRKIRQADFRGRRLLLVEDNEMNREIATELLEDEGIIVETAEDGDIAVNMVRIAAEAGKPEYYDAVLMDIQMPRMDGYKATKAIRELPALKGVHLPIIALSANAFEEDRQKSFECGMDEHVAKPINIDTLKKTLARFI